METIEIRSKIFEMINGLDGINRLKWIEEQAPGL